MFRVPPRTIATPLFLDSPLSSPAPLSHSPTRTNGEARPVPFWARQDLDDADLDAKEIVSVMNLPEQPEVTEKDLFDVEDERNSTEWQKDPKDFHSFHSFSIDPTELETFLEKRRLSHVHLTLNIPRLLVSQTWKEVEREAAAPTLVKATWANEARSEVDKRKGRCIQRVIDLCLVQTLNRKGLEHIGDVKLDEEPSQLISAFMPDRPLIAKLKFDTIPKLTFERPYEKLRLLLTRRAIPENAWKQEAARLIVLHSKPIDGAEPVDRPVEVNDIVTLVCRGSWVIELGRNGEIIHSQEDREVVSKGVYPMMVPSDELTSLLNEVDMNFGQDLIGLLPGERTKIKIQLPIRLDQPDSQYQSQQRLRNMLLEWGNPNDLDKNLKDALRLKLGKEQQREMNCEIAPEGLPLTVGFQEYLVDVEVADIYPAEEPVLDDRFFQEHYNCTFSQYHASKMRIFENEAIQRNKAADRTAVKDKLLEISDYPAPQSLIEAAVLDRYSNERPSVGIKGGSSSMPMTYEFNEYFAKVKDETLECIKINAVVKSRCMSLCSMSRCLIHPVCLFDPLSVCFINSASLL
eukprot:GHVN01057594.1.p1 GENE.GHVN01057594.1~~GHVN01057594.1.p1  ORF type:complete len:662 (+),score=102.26 GHVN01057594.1:262-1986(+)